MQTPRAKGGSDGVRRRGPSLRAVRTFPASRAAAKAKEVPPMKRRIVQMALVGFLLLMISATVASAWMRFTREVDTEACTSCLCIEASGVGGISRSCACVQIMFPGLCGHVAPGPPPPPPPEGG